MIKFIQTNFYYFFLIFFFFVNFNFFEKVYLIYLNDYEKRKNLSYGYCDQEGYGFIKKNINKKILNSNFIVENYGDFPNIKGLFYKPQNKNFSNSYIFLINQKDSSYIENNFKEYKILKNEENCYLLEKK